MPYSCMVRTPPHPPTLTFTLWSLIAPIGLSLEGVVCPQAPLEKLLHVGVVIFLSQLDQKWTSPSYLCIRNFLSEVARQSSHVLGQILATSHICTTVDPKDPRFIFQKGHSKLHKYSVIHAAEGKCGSTRRPSISVCPLRSVF